MLCLESAKSLLPMNPKPNSTEITKTEHQDPQFLQEAEDLQTCKPALSNPELAQQIDDRGNILVVDDLPDNLRLLAAMLTDRGYRVRKALNGPTALATVQAVPPDLILLDITMPEMNGYEVCQQLKTDDRTRDIPVIFISALSEVLDKVKAFGVGGVDYITKPFHSEEVIARVENQLTIQRQRQQLQAQNIRLQQEIHDRQRAEDAQQVYLHAVSHDLRNPVLGMTMVLKNLLKKSSQSSLSVPISVLQRMENSCDRQLALINSLLETKEVALWGVTLHRQSLHLPDLTEELVMTWQPILTDHQATLHHQVPTDLPPLQADANQLWRVFENLLANALKYNSGGVTLTLAAEVVAGAETLSIRCTVADDGVGMEADQAIGLFDLYRRGSSARNTKGLGLGLYLCRQIIQAHGGEIGVTTKPGEGASFWFTLPIGDGDHDSWEA